MTILLGDEEVYNNQGLVVAAASRGILHAVLSVDSSANIDNTDNRRYIISIWISLLGFESMARGIIVAKAITPSTIEENVVDESYHDNINNITPAAAYRVIWCPDGKKIAIAIRDELWFMDLVWADKKDNRSLSIAEVFQLVAVASGPKSRSDGPFASEIVSLKLQRRHKFSIDGLTCAVSYDSGRCLLLATCDVQSCKLYRLHWDGALTVRAQPSGESSPSTPHASSASSCISIEHILFSTWKAEVHVFPMQMRSSTSSHHSFRNKMSLSADNNTDNHHNLYQERGHHVSAMSISEQLRISALVHVDGSFSIIRLSSTTGYLSTQPIFAVVKQRQHISSSNSMLREVAGRVLALTVVDDRNVCGSNTTFLAILLRTRMFPSATSQPIHDHHSNTMLGEDDQVDYLLICYLSCAATAAVELKTISTLELGRIHHQQDHLPSTPSLIRAIGASSTGRGPVVIIYRSDTHIITGHGLLAAGTSLFRIDVQENVTSIDSLWFSANRLFIAAGNHHNNDDHHLIHALSWKFPLKDNQGNTGHIHLDSHEDEWSLEFFRPSTMRRSPSFGLHAAATNIASYRPSASIQHQHKPAHAIEYLVRESCAMDVRTRIRLPVHLRAELLTHERNLLVAESSPSSMENHHASSTIISSSPANGYIAAIAEAAMGEGLSFALAMETDANLKSSPQPLSLLLWLHNKHTKRWRGTNIDLDVDSLAVLVENPLPSNPIEAYNKQRASEAVYAHRIAALKGSIHGVISLAWFGSHSLVILSIRKARCCLEVMSRDIGAKPTTAQDFPRPALHQLYPLPAGAMPKQMMLTAINAINMQPNKKRSISCPSVLVTVLHEASISVYQITAIMKSLDSPTPSLIDYAVNMVYDISLALLPGLALPLQKIAPIAVDGEAEGLAIYALDALGRAIAIKPIINGQAEDAVISHGIHINSSPSADHDDDNVIVSNSHQFHASIISLANFIDLRVEEIGSSPLLHMQPSSTSQDVDDTEQPSPSLSTPLSTKMLSLLVLVSSESSTSSTTSSLAYLPHLRIIIPLPALPLLSSYSGIQRNAMMFIMRSSEMMYSGDVNRLLRSSSDVNESYHSNDHHRSSSSTMATLYRASFGSLYHHLHVSSSSSLSYDHEANHVSQPVTLHEISLPIHIFIGIIDHLVAALEATKQPSSSSIIHHIDMMVSYLQRFLTSLTLRKGRQCFAEDLEHHFLCLARDDSFKNTSIIYRSITCIMHSFARPLLTQILTRVARRIEIHQAQRLFPVPCSLNLLLGRHDHMVAGETRSITPLSLFLSCIQPHHASSSYQIHPHQARLLHCSARLLTFACEYEGGTESYRSTERCVSMALEVLHEATRALSLHLTSHCLEFACRLEDALMMMHHSPSSAAEEYGAMELDEEGQLRVSVAWPLTACNERLWRENGVFSTLGMVSPTLSYLVGGGAMWMMGRTLGVVAAAVTTPDHHTSSNNNSTDHHHNHHNAVTNGSSSSTAASSLRFNCYVQCTRFLSASSSSSSSGQQQHHHRGTLTVAFTALTCADFLKDHRYLACALFCASIMSRELACSRLRAYLTHELSSSSSSSPASSQHHISSVDVRYDDVKHDHMMSGDEDEEDMRKEMMIIFNRDIDWSIASLRALCRAEADSASIHAHDRDAFVHFDLPDCLQQMLHHDISSSSPASAASSPRHHNHQHHHRHDAFIRLPMMLRKGLALSLCITGRHQLSRCMAHHDHDHGINVDIMSEATLLDWIFS